MVQASSSQGSLWKLRSTVSIGGPITMTMVVTGLLLILAGAALQTGVWAGMFGILGALFVLTAVTARLLIWVYRRL